VTELRRLRVLADFARMLVGVPSYPRYVEHVRRHHPDTEPMTREAFFRERLEARYGGKGRVGRCC
jgi:uncharacterized short protein YbdD (DUF466 family)